MGRNSITVAVLAAAVAVAALCVMGPAAAGGYPPPPPPVPPVPPVVDHTIPPADVVPAGVQRTPRDRARLSPQELARLSSAVRLSPDASARLTPQELGQTVALGTTGADTGTWMTVAMFLLAAGTVLVVATRHAAKSPRRAAGAPATALAGPGNG